MSSLLGPISTMESPNLARQSFNPSSSDTQENVSSSVFVTRTRETISPSTTIATGAVMHYLQGTHNPPKYYHLLIS